MAGSYSNKTVKHIYTQYNNGKTIIYFYDSVDFIIRNTTFLVPRKAVCNSVA